MAAGASWTVAWKDCSWPGQHGSLPGEVPWPRHLLNLDRLSIGLGRAGVTRPMDLFEFAHGLAVAASVAKPSFAISNCWMMSNTLITF